MTCSYCGSRNPDGEHRCGRCGRKPSDTLTPAGLHVTHGALVAQPSYYAQPERYAEPATPVDLTRAVQGALFPERPASNVIPIESFAATRPETPRRSRQAAKPAAKPNGGQRQRARQRVSARASDTQSELDFLLPSAPAKPRELGTTVEAVIYCDSPVATPLHRTLAAAIDWSIVLVGYGLFLLAFRLFGGEFVLTKPNLLVFSAALLLVGFTYGLLWTVAGCETAGMRFTQLRLTNFDGFPPERKNLVLRFVGGCMSFSTLGLGVLWSLFDEEGLTWQDHISGTFPTPRDTGSQIVRRR